MKDLMKILAKKKEAAPMDEMEKSSRMNVLQDLKKSMQGLMKGDLQKAPMQVEVAADKPEALTAGLDLAKETVGEMKDPMMSQESSDEESEMEDPLSEMAEDKSPEELDEMIRKLEMMKALKK